VGSTLGADHRRRAMIESWNGTRWSQAQPAATPSLRDVFLVTVSCATPNSCMAAGVAERAHTRAFLVEHWNGSRWRRQTPPVPSRSGQLVGPDSVSCPSATVCFLTGDFARPTEIERWNGRRWRVSATLGPGLGLDSISCSSPSACLAGGGSSFDDPIARSWNGSRWQRAPVPDDQETELSQVSCTASTFCLAVGTTYEGDAPGGGAYRWTGSRLNHVAYGAPSGNATGLFRVSCASSNSCLALGGFGLADATEGMGETWTGSALTVAFTAGGIDADPWAAVSCRPAFCMIVGTAKHRVVAERFDQ
jgi:hypothetical protein